MFLFRIRFRLACKRSIQVTDLFLKHDSSKYGWSCEPHTDPFVRAWGNPVAMILGSHRVLGKRCFHFFERCFHFLHRISEKIYVCACEALLFVSCFCLLSLALLMNKQSNKQINHDCFFTLLKKQKCCQKARKTINVFFGVNNTGTNFRFKNQKNWLRGRLCRPVMIKSRNRLSLTYLCAIYEMLAFSPCLPCNWDREGTTFLSLTLYMEGKAWQAWVL